MTDRTVGGFQLAEQLGQGGMGTVFRARQTALEREVALKVLRPGAFSSAEIRARFEREMQLAAQLAHPGLVRVLDGGTADGVAYIAMELVRGRPLHELIAQHAPFAWTFALALTVQIAEALRYLHERDILHRDIKPSNILLAKSGAVKLVDFGLARYAGSTVMTEEGAVVGTLQFLAPELLIGDPATPASELWSVGCVLYVMLTGHMHVETASSTAFAQAVVNDPVRPPGLLVPGLPAPVSQLVMSLLEREPARRESSAKALAERAEELLERAGWSVDRILAAGVIDEIAVWRALPVETGEEERTVTVRQSGGITRVISPAPPRGRSAFAAVLVVLVLSLWLAFRPVTQAPPAPPGAVTSAAPVPAPAARPRWHIPPAYFPRLKAGGPEAARAAAELATLHPVPLGLEPGNWLHAHRLAVWFADRDRTALPPHLTAGSLREIPGVLAHTIKKEIADAARQSNEALLSYAIRAIANFPADARAWLLLGLALERSGSPGEARTAYDKALALLGTNELGDFGEPCWVALGQALTQVPAPDIEPRWFGWLGQRPAKFYAWQALRTALERRAPAAYERLLERGAANPGSAEPANYYLGLRLMDRGEKERARAAWRRALEANPDSNVVKSALR